jgi:predicted porin
MQKKLIVLAIAALASTSAFADSTVGIYGVLDAAIANVQSTGNIGGTTAVSGGLASSRFGIKATEDLEGGLKVVGVLEYQLDPETNNTVGSASTTTVTPTGGLSAYNANTFYARQQMLALAGDFGTVATGYLQTTGWDFGVKYNVVAGSAVSPLGNLTKGQGFLIGDQGGAKRAQRAVAYISPSLSGLTVAVNYSTDFAAYGDITTPTTGTPSGITAALASVNYDNGPLSVGLVYAGLNEEAYTANQTEYALGVAYDAGVAKITATYQTNKHGNATTATTATANATSANSVYSIGAAIPVSVGVVVVSYAGSTINSIASTGAGSATQNASSYAVGFLKPLSKTTTAYLAYSAVKQGDGTSGVTVANDLISTSGATTTNGVAGGGGTSSILALGLSKKF